MKHLKKNSETDQNNSIMPQMLKNCSFLFIFLTSLNFLPNQLTRSHEIFLKCIGKFEVNRGELIKPDWEISNLKIDLNGLASNINDKGKTFKGTTLIRGNSYTITHKDNRNRVKSKYRINTTNGTYTVDYPQRNKTLIGTCQKGRG